METTCCRTEREEAGKKKRGKGKRGKGYERRKKTELGEKKTPHKRESKEGSSETVFTYNAAS